ETRARLALWSQRFGAWGRCWTDSGTPELRNQLELNDMSPDWVQLRKVAAFLRASNIANGEFTCYDGTTLPLYMQLDTTPSTRYILPGAFIHFYPQQAERIRRELKESNQRFIVTDMKALLAFRETEKADAERPGQPLAYPPAFPDELLKTYPFTEPVVFRAGRYYVHRAKGHSP